jgi:hypothetical protein
MTPLEPRTDQHDRDTQSSSVGAAQTPSGDHSMSVTHTRIVAAGPDFTALR